MFYYGGGGGGRIKLSFLRLMGVFLSILAVIFYLCVFLGFLKLYNLMITSNLAVRYIEREILKERLYGQREVNYSL